MVIAGSGIGPLTTCCDSILSTRSGRVRALRKESHLMKKTNGAKTRRKYKTSKKVIPFKIKPVQQLHTVR